MPLHRTGALALALALLTSSAGAEPPAAKATADDPGATVLVAAEDFQITVDDVRQELAHQSGRARYVREHPEALKSFVQEMLRTELLAREAARRGYGTQPAVQQAVKEEMVQELQREVLGAQITPGAIPEEEVKAYYEAHGDQYRRPAMRRARHILLEKRPQAEALLDEARAADDREFQRLAREHSIDTETKQRGGDLRFFSREADPTRRDAPIHPALREAAFRLKELGDTVKQPVAVDDHWSILRLTGIRAARETALSAAEASIRTRLWRERRREALEQLLARLRRDLKPEVHAERVLAIDLSDVGPRPDGFLRDRPTRAERAKAPSAPAKKP